MKCHYATLRVSGNCVEDFIRAFVHILIHTALPHHVNVYDSYPPKWQTRFSRSIFGQYLGSVSIKTRHDPQVVDFVCYRAMFPLIKCPYEDDVSKNLIVYFENHLQSCCLEHFHFRQALTVNRIRNSRFEPLFALSLPKHNPFRLMCAVQFHLHHQFFSLPL